MLGEDWPDIIKELDEDEPFKPFLSIVIGERGPEILFDFEIQTDIGDTARANFLSDAAEFK